VLNVVRRVGGAVAVLDSRLAPDIHRVGEIVKPAEYKTFQANVPSGRFRWP
jgi:hypothetical protein